MGRRRLEACWDRGRDRRWCTRARGDGEVKGSRDVDKRWPPSRWGHPAKTPRSMGGASVWMAMLCPAALGCLVLGLGLGGGSGAGEDGTRHPVAASPGRTRSGIYQSRWGESSVQRVDGFTKFILTSLPGMGTTFRNGSQETLQHHRRARFPGHHAALRARMGRNVMSGVHYCYLT